MMHAGVVNAPIERSGAAKHPPGGPITPVHDLNVPYEGTEEYETPTADMLFPPVSLVLQFTIFKSLVSCLLLLFLFQFCFRF